MSGLARFSLKNKALVALVTLMAVVTGLVATTSLRQELIPSLQIPIAAVVTPYPGAAPEVVEDQVTAPVEAATSGVDGVVGTTSSSSNSFSVVTVELEYGTDTAEAEQQLRSGVEGLQLPDSAEPQVITGGIDDLPVLQLAATGGEDPDAMVSLLEDDIVPALAGVDGVRDVALSGISTDVIRIEPDQAAVAAAGLTPDAITAALQSSGVAIPAGSVTDAEQQLTVQVGDTIDDIEELREIPVLPTAAGPSAAQDGTQGGTQGGTQDGTATSPNTDAATLPLAVLTLADVASVELVESDATSFARTNGEASIGIAVTKTPDGNTVAVSEQVQELLPELEEVLGADAELTVVFDQAPFIEQSIEDLTVEGLLGLLMAIIVIAVFLLSLRSTLVTAVSIPLSLLIALLGLWAGGFTLNILTLAALTISVGRVVDDSIVVIENIKRHLAYGELKTQAILTGVREVAGAITASTLTTAAVFLPIALVGGLIGELFRPFAVTVALALLASLFVSLTIIPVLAAWFLRAPKGAGTEGYREQVEEKERNGWLQRGYLPVLRATIAHPVVTLVVAVGLLAGTVGAATMLRTDFLGDSGQNTLTVSQELPAGTTLEATDEAARQVEAVVADLPEVETYQVSVGSSGDGAAALFGGGGATTATFSITTDVNAEPSAVADAIRSGVQDLSDVGEVTVTAGQAGPGTSQLEVLVQATDLDALEQATQAATEAVAGIDGVSDVTNNLAAALPTLVVDVDRDAAAQAGLTETQVGQVVASRLSAQTVGQLTLDGTAVDLELSAGEAPQSAADIEDLQLPSPLGPVALTDVATVEQVEVPVSITRVDGQRSATVTAASTGDDLGAVTADLHATVADLDLPAGTTAEIGGVSADQEDAFADLALALLAAIAIVYLIMAATFRSLAQPLILLVSVPFAATGAVAMLLLTDIALGVASLIGMLMLVGIVVTNAIVLIDLINQYRRAGSGIDEAVTEGARLRLRPILMTALATILALTPMAFGLTGGSAFISQPLAVVVIGGLISSTLLTLVLVPVLYTLVERATGRLRRRRGDEEEGHAPEHRVEGAEPDAGDSDESNEPKHVASTPA